MFASKALPDRFPHRVGQVHVAYKGTLNGERTVYDPRPYDPAMNNPPNPILMEFREDVSLNPEIPVNHLALIWVARDMIIFEAPNATLAQGFHAYQVLSRLAALES